MKYYLDVFSPETYRAFGNSDRSVSGFRESQRTRTAKVKPGDVLVCYVTQLSRWVGLLEIVDGPFDDSAPRFLAENDPYTIRFHVKPIAWLDIPNGIPIKSDVCWPHLSFTRDLARTSGGWTGALRKSLNTLDPSDGRCIETLIREQVTSPRPHALSDADERILNRHTVQREVGTVTVTVPDDAEDTDQPPRASGIERESIQIQALLAKIGIEMGFKSWLPANDRLAVQRQWSDASKHMIDRLPLNYDTTTLQTIERIDVLWLKGRSIVRAFEVEHTTAIYSGILRMADLLALQPNMDIHLHIVAPEDRRAKVFEEICRPVFSLLERRPLSKCCSFIGYEGVRELAESEHLKHLSDSVLDDYAEFAVD